MPVAGAITRTFAWLVVHLRWLVVLGWIAAAVATTVWLPPLGQDASLASLEPEGAPAVRAEQDMSRHFPVPLFSRTAVVQRDPRGLPPGYERRAIETARGLSQHPDPALPGLIGALPVPNAQAFVPGAREDGTTLVTFVFTDGNQNLDEATALARGYGKLHAQPGLVGVTGAGPSRVAQWQRIADALPLVTAAAVLLILVVVGGHFRSVPAPLLTLVAAAIAYATTIGLVGWIGRQLDLAVPQEVEPLMVVLLLGVVTDYAVFFLSGTRRALAQGLPRLQAAEAAARSNGPIVFTAGIVVAAGTGALVVGQSSFFRAFGPGLAVTALVAMLVAVTFVPSVLAILGSRAFWPRRPDGRDLEDIEPPRWRQAVARFTARPAVAAIVALACVGVLVVAAAGLAGAHLGVGSPRDLPGDSEARRAAAAADAGFAPGILSPSAVLVEGRGVARRAPQLVALQRELARRPGVAGVIGPAQQPARIAPGAVLAEDGNAARMAVILADNPLGATAIKRIRELKADLPGLVRQAGLGATTARVAGDTALAAETIDGMQRDLLRVGIAALLVNFLVLALFLRSWGPPVYLLAASVLALGATLGLTTLVFETWLGYEDLTYYVPFAAAVLLVALGSDYNVFVVGRIWQRARDMPLRDAVAYTAPRASRAITVAGLTLALSFAALAFVPLRSFRELAFCLATGVLLETFLVRSFLVPALISLVGCRRLRRPTTRPDPGETGAVRREAPV